MARTTGTDTRGEKDDGWTAEERAAMKEHAAEIRRAKQGKGSADKQAQEAEAQRAAIAEMPADERAIAERIRDIVAKEAPELSQRTWYGMPAWALDGKVVVFFQPAAKFKARYSNLGFNDAARLDDGTFWPTSFAVTALSAAIEKQIAALVRRAVG